MRATKSDEKGAIPKKAAFTSLAIVGRELGKVVSIINSMLWMPNATPVMLS